jgi:hypothetical protein
MRISPEAAKVTCPRSALQRITVVFKWEYRTQPTEKTMMRCRQIFDHVA